MHDSSTTSTRPSGSCSTAPPFRFPSHLVAKSLDIGLGQLLAGHQALNPAIEGGDGGGLEVEDGRSFGGCSPDVLHIGVHGSRARLGGGRRREELEENDVALALTLTVRSRLNRERWGTGHKGGVRGRRMRAGSKKGVEEASAGRCRALGGIFFWVVGRTQPVCWRMDSVVGRDEREREGCRY